MFFLLHADDAIFDDFPKISDHFSKIFQNCSEGQTYISEHFPNISEHFPKITEDCWRLPKTAKVDLKMFWSYTNKFNCS